ncbi:hypothetical protein M947_06450 [Sulfurimonas hongkongensis]|uniref:Uncharacterized protein n=1 Tax=Sulfurimonas hongkongensis TaxID=1172190 RepID=T0JF25_9BACT|nr:hypothetical protein [Sulfurimonas hongkongensis]EQB39630.1 hypothetical protein M947_06450 [Sulfurimonas hongkongensis]
MPTINLPYVVELILKYARKYAYALAIVFFLTLITALMGSFVTAFFVFYNLINTFIAHLSSSSNGDFVSKMFGLMSCIGFIQAFNSVKSIFISAVLFLLWRIVFAQFLRVYYLIIQAVKPLVK